MRCLILGGAGFIGSSVVDELLVRGHQVRVFDRRNVDTRNLSDVLSRIELIQGDFLNEDDLRGAVSGIDVVVHLASTTQPKSSNDNVVYDVETNVAGSLTLLSLARGEGVQKIIFASSGGTVYGIPQFLPIPETHPTEPICSYGITKLTFEKYLHLYRHLYGLDYVVLRIANPYGARQDPTSGQGAVTTFLWRTLKREPIIIWGDGTIARDYLYIGDLAAAFVRVIEGETQSTIYNIGCGNSHTLNEILELIRSVTNMLPTVTYTSARKLDVPMNYLDITRARTQLGWEPKVTLEEGIARTWSVFKLHC